MYQTENAPMDAVGNPKGEPSEKRDTNWLVRLLSRVNVV